MKKIIFGLLILSVFSGVAFTQESIWDRSEVREIWWGTGAEFNNAFGLKKDRTDGYLFSPGAYFDFNYFYNVVKKFDMGGTIHFSFNVPAHNSDKIYLIDRDGDNTHVQWNFFIGPSFKYSFTDNITIYSTLGAAIEIFNTYYDEVEYTSIETGLGLDLGLKIDLNDKVFLKFGNMVIWNLFKSGDPIYDLGVKPHIGIGMNANSIYSLGKPK